jgi:hypothetical protein
MTGKTDAMDPFAHLLDSHWRRLDGAASDPRSEFALGRLVRLRRGSYVPTAVWLDAAPHERFAMAVAAYARTHPGALFCGETALFLHGLPVVKTPLFIDVAIPSTTKLGVRPNTFAVRGKSEEARRAGQTVPPPVRRHQHVSTEAVTVGPYRTVPLIAALTEILATGRFARALTVADGLLHRWGADELLEAPDVAASIARIPQRNRRERAELIATLARRGAESPGESVSRALMHLFGFPEPILQKAHWDSEGLIGRTDFAWDVGAEPVGEFDGWGKYFRQELTGGEDPRDIIRREKRRENRLLALGHAVLRWDWADLERPASFRAKLTEGGLLAKTSHPLAGKFS